MTSLWHKININNIPPEIVFKIFGMFMNIKDIIKFGNINNYVFDIYKTNLDEIITELIKNNTTNGLISYVILGCYMKNDSIEKKLNNIKLIVEFLSTNTIENLREIYQTINRNAQSLSDINKKKQLIAYFNYRIIQKFPHKLAETTCRLSEDQFKVFMNLIKFGFNINISYEATVNFDNEQIENMKQLVNRGMEEQDAYHVISNITNHQLFQFVELINEDIPSRSAVYVINNFDEIKTDKMEELIEFGFKPDDAIGIVDTFEENEIEIISQIPGITNLSNLIDNIIEFEFNEMELNIIIEFVKNNFDTTKIMYLVSSLTNYDNFNNDHVIKCIELKKKGISENNIQELIDGEKLEDFNFDYYDMLMNKINDSDTVIQGIINGFTDALVEFINKGFKGKHIWYLIKRNYSEEQCNLIKPYLEYIKNEYNINYFFHHYDEMKNQIQMFKDNDIGAKYIVKCLFGGIPSFYNSKYTLDLIRVIKELQTYQLDDNIINIISDCYHQIKHSIFPIEARPELQSLNTFELPLFNSCISLIKKGFVCKSAMNTIKFCAEFDIDIKYVNELNEEAFEFVKTFNELQLKVYLNLCKETNNVDYCLSAMKALKEDILVKIDNFAVSTGVKYFDSMMGFINKK